MNHGGVDGEMNYPPLVTFFVFPESECVSGRSHGSASLLMFSDEQSNEVLSCLTYFTLSRAAAERGEKRDDTDENDRIHFSNNLTAPCRLRMLLETNCFFHEIKNIV